MYVRVFRIEITLSGRIVPSTFTYLPRDYVYVVHDFSPLEVQLYYWEGTYSSSGYELLKSGDFEFEAEENNKAFHYHRASQLIVCILCNRYLEPGIAVVQKEEGARLVINRLILHRPLKQHVLLTVTYYIIIVYSVRPVRVQHLFLSTFSQVFMEHQPFNANQDRTIAATSSRSVAGCRQGYLL